MTRLLYAVALVAILLAAGCRQNPPASANSLKIDVTAEPNPPVSGDAKLIVTIRDAGGSPVNDATLSVRGDMTHAGMTPVLRDNVTAQNGVYTVPFQWTMGGSWIVEVTAKLKDGTAATQTFTYTVGEGSASMTMDASASAEATMDMGAAQPTATMNMSGMDMAAPLTPSNRGGG